MALIASTSAFHSFSSYIASRISWSLSSVLALLSPSIKSLSHQWSISQKLYRVPNKEQQPQQTTRMAKCLWAWGTTWTNGTNKRLEPVLMVYMASILLVLARFNFRGGRGVSVSKWAFHFLKGMVIRTPTFCYPHTPLANPSQSLLGPLWNTRLGGVRGCGDSKKWVCG